MERTENHVQHLVSKPSGGSLVMLMKVTGRYNLLTSLEQSAHRSHVKEVQSPDFMRRTSSSNISRTTSTMVCLARQPRIVSAFNGFIRL